MADAPGAVAKRTRQGLKLQGEASEAKKTKRDEPPAPEEPKPVSERFGSSCPICYEEWDPNAKNIIASCCLRRLCGTCVAMTRSAPCPLCRAPRPTTDAEDLARLRRHAEKEVPEALFHLGNAYCMGNLGLEIDMKQSAKILKRAVELGDAEAMVGLGYSYEFGEGVKRDIKKAKQLYRTAANRGLPSANLYLANRLCESGDHEEAFPIMKIAAEHGVTMAEYNVGCMFETGEGAGAIDLDEARRWYARAASKGDINSEYNLGCFYFLGRGVAVDLDEAKRWFSRAVAHGDENSKPMVAEVERQIRLRDAARELLRAAGGDKAAARKAIDDAESDSDSVSESDPDHSA